MALPERVPPQNIEAEQAVLGAMLIKKEAIIEVQEILRPDDFYRETHRIIYEAMVRLQNNDEAVDLVTLTEELRKTDMLDKVGGLGFITQLANIVATAANVSYHAKIAKEKAELNNACKSAVIAELLPVIDNLDRALAHNTDNPDEYKKGVEMIGSQFYTVLEKLGVESFGEAGDAFDPNLHNAVMHIEDENLGENAVAAVFAKGYRLGDKVIRPATVQVAN